MMTWTKIKGKKINDVDDGDVDDDGDAGDDDDDDDAWRKNEERKEIDMVTWIATKTSPKQWSPISLIFAVYFFFFSE